MKTANKRFLIAGALSSALLALAACGKSSSAPGPILPGMPGYYPQVSTQTICPNGQIAIGTVCSTAQSFQQACYYSGGQFGTVNGKELCKITRASPAYSLILKGSIPRLNPSAPYAAAKQYGINVQKNDIVEISASGSGFWGRDLRTLNCEDETTVEGYRDGSLDYHEGMPQGLVASDGSEVFFVGSYTQKTIAHNGALRIGFNAPPGVGECVTAREITFKVTSCVDASNVAYPCQ